MFCLSTNKYKFLIATTSIIGYNSNMEKRFEKKQDFVNEENKTCSAERVKKENRPADKCPYCGIRFNNPLEMLRHVFTIHAS